MPISDGLRCQNKKSISGLFKFEVFLGFFTFTFEKKLISRHFKILRKGAHFMDKGAIL